MAGRIIEAELRITGSDKSGAAFAGVIKHAKELEKTIAGMKAMNLNDAGMAAASTRIKEQTRLLQGETRAAQQLQRSLALANGEAAKHGSLLKRFGGTAGIIASGAGMYVGYEARHAARSTFETYREFDKERRFGKAVMGLTDEQQERLVKQAIHLGASTKYNDIKVLEAQRNLAARGLNIDQVEGVIGPAANLGMAMGLGLPEAVTQIESSLFQFKRQLTTLPETIAAATRAADLQTRAAKSSGMTPEDISHLYQFGATPARLAGVSEETLLAFGGVLKRANIRGDEAGVAFRALMAAAQSPTRKAKEAMLAHGLNYKNYQHNPDSLALNPFVENIAAQYGVRLSGGAQKGLGAIFSNKDTISDPAKFAPAVMEFLKGELHGGNAKSLRSIAGAATRYRDASMKGIDTNKFLADLMSKLGNLQFSNAIFGSKQGGRIATGVGDPETLNRILDLITHHSEGYSQKIASGRMEGFDGAMSRLEGSIKNIETAIGRSWDNGGKGGPATHAVDYVAKLAQSFAELDSTTVQVSSGFAGIAASLVAIKSALTVLGFLTAGIPGAKAAAGGLLGALTTWGLKLTGIGNAVALLYYGLHPTETGPRSFDEPYGPGKFTVRDIHDRLGGPIDRDEARERRGMLPDIRGAVGGNDYLSPPKAEIDGNATLNVKIDVQPSADFNTRFNAIMDNKINAFSRSGAAPSGSTGSIGHSMPEVGPLP